MRTLATELGAWVDRLSPAPRVYADANMPAGLVTFMRVTLRWDVHFVMEHAELRRARDTEHFHLARQMRRTLITLDRDYLDDQRFPLNESSGVIVLSGPDETQLARLLRTVDRRVLRDPAGHGPPLPLAGQKMLVEPGPRQVPARRRARRR
jgi:predicted nuclease of predicted toxin-antitoxin system